jgi:hypothetical protein
VKSSEGLFLPTQKIESAFDKWWPDLEEALKGVSMATGTYQKRREEREILEEVWEIVRSLSRSREHVVPRAFFTHETSPALLEITEEDLLKLGETQAGERNDQETLSRMATRKAAAAFINAQRNVFKELAKDNLKNALKDTLKNRKE